RIDMSEFMEKHTVSRLVGAPPGYAGNQEGGQLTQAVRQQPYAVILLDEIEKAHQDVFNLFLQVLDDGRLTDGQGRTIPFQHSVVIMTSNLGAECILNAEHNSENLEAQLQDILYQHFRPEFLNRIDEILTFQRLQQPALHKICLLLLQQLQQQLREQHIHLEIPPHVVAFLVEQGTQPSLGARPLKRTLIQHLQNPLSIEILEQTIQPHQHIIAQLHPTQPTLCFQQKSNLHGGAKS
ncbi:MAG: AAA family ATPase, partial [Myxococcota bacterium]